MPGVREIYIDAEHEDTEQLQDPHPGHGFEAQNSGGASHPSYRNFAQPVPTTHRNSMPASPILRREVGAPASAPSYPPPAARKVYSPSPSQNHSRSNSRMSGVLRGPVPDLYAFGGETVDNDEELDRLEEEERRIDEAIQESERLGGA